MRAHWAFGDLELERPVGDAIVLADLALLLDAQFVQSNKITVHNDNEFRKLKTQFDRGFCINVLSVIPSPKHRRQVAATIKWKTWVMPGRGSMAFLLTRAVDIRFTA
jgi:hypothetical protein